MCCGGDEPSILDFANWWDLYGLGDPPVSGEEDEEEEPYDIRDCPNAK